jgi:hypothetical protein
MKDNPQKYKYGGDLKTGRVPPGYYSARDACAALAVSRTTLGEYVERGHVIYKLPPGKKNGFYEQKSVDAFANEIRAFALGLIQQSTKPQRVTYSWATRFDLQGISDVLASFDWPSPSLKQRQNWLARNPHIYYVIRFKNLVLGYISIMAHPWDITDALLAGRMKGRDLQPRDVLPFLPGQENDCHFGAAVRDIPEKRIYAGRLIRDFFEDLGKLAEQENIIIHKLYGMTDEDDGRRLAKSLEFMRLPKEEGDVFGERYVLDMRTGEHPFVQKYRESWNH